MTLLMTRRMLHGIRQRAERRTATDGAQGVERAGGGWPMTPLQPSYRST